MKNDVLYTNTKAAEEQMGTRHNKNDIHQKICYLGNIYEFQETLQGTYNKANIYKRVIEQKNTDVMPTKEPETITDILLLSYTTVVAQFIYTDKHYMMTLHGYYSPTTNRHMNTFLKKYGFHNVNKANFKKNNTFIITGVQELNNASSLEVIV